MSIGCFIPKTMLNNKHIPITTLPAGIFNFLISCSQYINIIPSTDIQALMEYLFSVKGIFHEGLDIGTWYNTPVLATADGKVKYAGWKGGYGYVLIIEHGFGNETTYAHLNKIKASKGENVRREQVIALSGNSGKSTGPHLHYEVRKNNIPQNPRNFIGR